MDEPTKFKWTADVNCRVRSAAREEVAVNKQTVASNPPACVRNNLLEKRILLLVIIYTQMEEDGVCHGGWESQMSKTEGEF